MRLSEWHSVLGILFSTRASKAQERVTEDGRKCQFVVFTLVNLLLTGVLKKVDSPCFATGPLNFVLPLNQTSLEENL